MAESVVASYHVGHETAALCCQMQVDNGEFRDDTPGHRR